MANRLVIALIMYTYLILNYDNEDIHICMFFKLIDRK